MSKLILCALALSTAPCSAYAAVIVTVQPGVLAAPVGATAVIDFDSAMPAGFNLTGGQIQDVSNGLGAEPAGDSSYYLTADPNDPAKLTSTVGYDTVSLFWGSIDSYNTLSLLGKAGNVIASFTGSQIAPTGASGNQTSTISNARVTFDSSLPIYGLEFQSSQPGFEADNIAYSSPIGAVPEPASWAMTIGGMGVVGAALRQRRKNGLGTMLPA